MIRDIKILEDTKLMKKLKVENLKSIRGLIQSYFFDDSMQNMLVFWPDIKVVSCRKAGEKEFKNIGEAGSETDALKMFVNWVNKDCKAGEGFKNE